jgi:hypothetical protein
MMQIAINRALTTAYGYGTPIKAREKLSQQRRCDDD